MMLTNRLSAKNKLSTRLGRPRSLAFVYVALHLLCPSLQLDVLPIHVSVDLATFLARQCNKHGVSACRSGAVFENSTGAAGVGEYSRPAFWDRNLPTRSAALCLLGASATRQLLAKD